MSVTSTHVVRLEFCNMGSNDAMMCHDGAAMMQKCPMSRMYVADCTFFTRMVIIFDKNKPPLIHNTRRASYTCSPRPIVMNGSRICSTCCLVYGAGRGGGRIFAEHFLNNFFSWETAKRSKMARHVRTAGSRHGVEAGISGI